MSTRLEWALKLAHCEEHFTACASCDDCAGEMAHLADVLHEVGRQLRANLFPAGSHQVHAWATETAIMAKREAA